jgi:xanthine dehydrogenase accessory factor
MKDIDQILQLWRKTEQAGDSAVLATVVKTRGSSYRLPGARLLLTRTGRRAGSVSGGCLEDDLVKKAWWLTEAGPCIRKYDTTPEGEIGSGYGLGCNGIIHVLLERLSPGTPNLMQNPLDLIEEVRASRQPGAIAHLIDPARWAGQRLVVDIRGRVSDNLSDEGIAPSLERQAREAIACSAALAERGAPEDSGAVFIETVTPAIRLLIFGAGDDAVPVTDLAKYLGWSVSVFDGRAHYARSEKFPNADEVTVRGVGWGFPLMDPWTVGVLMTHSYSQDLDVLRAMAPNPPRYLGILGPHKRTAQLLADAAIEPARLGDVLHGPMGLDIGADGPEQVALAVIAEIQAALNGREGGQLRKRDGSIHARDEQAGESRQFRVHSISCA